MGGFYLHQPDDYFTDIEAAVSRHQGKRFSASPSDWKLMEKWKALGVPLHLIVREIDGKSLAYIESRVEKAFGEWQGSQVGRSETSVIEYLCQTCFDTGDKLVPDENPKFTGAMRVVPCECV